jgi:hypothetical protein
MMLGANKAPSAQVGNWARAGGVDSLMYTVVTGWRLLRYFGQFYTGCGLNQ